MKTNILKQRRLELGLTQQAVAIQLGMHIRQYQRFEYGEQSLSSCSMRTGLKIPTLVIRFCQIVSDIKRAVLDADSDHAGLVCPVTGDPCVRQTLQKFRVGVSVHIVDPCGDNCEVRVERCQKLIGCGISGSVVGDFQ